MRADGLRVSNGSTRTDDAELLLLTGIGRIVGDIVTSIFDLADVGLRAAGDGARAREVLERIRHASHRGAKLRDQLLACSRDGGPIELVDLSATVREIDELLQATLPSSAVLRFELQPDLPLVRTSTAQVRRLILHMAAVAAARVEHDTKLVVRTGTDTVARNGLDVRHVHVEVIGPAPRDDTGRASAGIAAIAEASGGILRLRNERPQLLARRVLLPVAPVA